MADALLLKGASSITTGFLKSHWSPEENRRPISIETDTSGRGEKMILGETTPVPLSESQKSKLASETLVKSFIDLPQGWNGYDANPIPVDVVLRAVQLLRKLHIQPPEIFPTGRESIQFEYNRHGKSLEIEIQRDSYHILQIINEKMSPSVEQSTEAVINIIADFYASTGNS